MMVQQTIRWQQRFNNYRKALVKLTQAVELLSGQFDREEAVDELLQEGLIQRFEYTHELAWKVMKDYAEYQGYTDVRGSRDAIRKALEMGLIDDRAWMETIEDRNLTVHNYDNEIASEIYENIMGTYYSLFVAFAQKMQSLVEPTLFD
jgi:nucleotidyltransferase substrate binding protein (TIGR01987 family)